VGVASHDHVLAAVKGGFCQLGHGPEVPVRCLVPGDRILYYSPRERMREGAVLQAFTAAGEVLEGEAYRVESETGFRPYRRNVSYLNLGNASIRLLLPNLSFTRDHSSWGQVFRRASIEITSVDYDLIIQAMVRNSRFLHLSQASRRSR
jgi:hypothetical protein